MGFDNSNASESHTHMIHAGALPAVRMRNGELWADSRDVAAVFGKEHKNILADIDGLINSMAEFSAMCNFNELADPHPTVPGRMIRRFEMNRDGFTLLAMGFTGEKALRFKVAYIAEFSRMEKELREAGQRMVIADSPSMRAAIGGIVKGVVHKELGEVLPIMVESALAADPRRAVLDYVSIRQLLDQAKALPKGRNRLNRKLGRAMRDLAATQAVALRRCAHSNVWLYPRSFSDRCMIEFGNAMVAEHNAAVVGQGVLPFKRRGSDPASARPETEQATH